MNESELLNLGKRLEPEKSKRNNSYHVPSRIQPDTLFHFMSRLDYLIATLNKKAIYPRYCKENLRYLRLSDIKEIAFPMSCFCNIGLQKLENHMACYGYYGIAFPKSWCMQNGFLAVHYLNKDAELVRDIRSAFNAALRSLNEKRNKNEKTLSNYLLHQLMYYKPYQDRIEYRVDGKRRMKCLADECEWRRIPSPEDFSLPLILKDEWQLKNHLRKYNDAISDINKTSLKFDYKDLKYIMVENMASFDKLSKEIMSWQNDRLISSQECNLLLSKTLVWDEIKGDF